MMLLIRCSCCYAEGHFIERHILYINYVHLALQKVATGLITEVAALTKG